MQAKLAGFQFTGPEILERLFGVNTGSPVLTDDCSRAYSWNGKSVCDSAMAHQPIAKEVSDFCSAELKSPSSPTNTCKSRIDEYQARILPYNLAVISRVCTRPLDPLHLCG